MQTIIGRHMNSVAFPLMTVILVYRGRHYEQKKSVTIYIIRGYKMVSLYAVFHVLCRTRAITRAHIARAYVRACVF